MAGNTTEALRRIHENKHTRSKILDLSGLGLSELPEELWDCVWVEELGLGYHYHWNEELQRWYDYWDRRLSDKMPNELSVLPLSIANLQQLTHLFLDSTAIADFSPLCSMPSLSSLDLSHLNVSDLRGLNGLSSLSSLKLNSAKVNNLNGLSGLSGLKSLDLSFSEVSDLRGLSDLSSLSSLKWWSIKLNDLSGLSGLSNLTSLDLSSAKVSYLNGLSSLSSLSNLDLGHSEINDVKGLSGLSSLISLDLGHSKVSDLSGLNTLLNLTSLDLSGTPVSDLSPLLGLPNLSNLDLINAKKMSDLSPLSGLLSLSSLNLYLTPVSDLSPLSGLLNLSNLNLSSTNVRDLRPLSTLLNLNSLDISSTPLSDLHGLEGLLSLSRLDLDSTKVTNLSPLRSLSSLTDLSLIATPVSDLSPLSGLTSLNKLNLKSDQVSDVSPLSSLLSLKSLFLKSPRLSDISPLRNLSELNDLDLSFSDVYDLSGLSGLSNLTSLELNYNKRLSDVSPLSSLSQLKSLELNNTQVSDLSGLSSLSQLNALNLSETPLSDLSTLSTLSRLEYLNLNETSVSDLSPLSGLSNLRSLDLEETQVSDLSPLSGLSQLKSLSVVRTPLTDIQILSKLKNLIDLRLIDINIDDLCPLCGLSNLVELDLRGSTIPYFPFELLWLPKLEALHLEEAHCFNLPSELTYEYEALPDLRNYHTELQKNAYTSYQAKVITVGNGRVGKTSVLKALFQLGAFDPLEDSTHGIRLFHTTVPLPSEQADAKLMLWDFGGQELYHATHRIFMESRALYLLIWDEHTEQNLGEEAVQLQGKTYFFRNFPLSYWLGNIRALSQFAKIIVICNKADDGREHFPTVLLDLQSQYKITSFFSVSAKTGFHIPDLFQHVQTQLEQMHEMGMQMPLSWKKVQDQLSAIQDQPYIHFTTYRNICTEEGLSEDSAYTLLRFLHHSGFVFWHERYLNDQIVLDQKWALDAIYTLLDRNSWYKVLKGKALLKYSELAECWSEYPEEQVELFLEIMQSCELALKIEDKPYSHDPYYLIPEFLPDQPALAVAQTWENAAGPIFHFRFQHHFFHSALMQRFIVRSARLAKSYDLLWRSGIMIKVEETLAHIQVHPEEGRIEILLRGPRPRHLIERLKNEISQIQEVKGDAGFLLSLSGLPDEWIPLEQVKQGSTHVVSTSGKVLEFAPFFSLIYAPQREEEPKPLDLKELADRESGAQLLE